MLFIRTGNDVNGLAVGKHFLHINSVVYLYERQLTSWLILSNDMHPFIPVDYIKFTRI